MNALGKHLLIELYDCTPESLDDLAAVRTTMIEAAQMINATVINVAGHQFQPHGVSVIVLIAESHLSIHTWPEHGYAAVDLFTCSDRIPPSTVIEPIRQALGARRVTSMEVHRGQLAPALVGSTS